MLISLMSEHPSSMVPAFDAKVFENIEEYIIYCDKTYFNLSQIAFDRVWQREIIFLFYREAYVLFSNYFRPKVSSSDCRL